METLELFTPGCLGTCWHGKYHYMEPWAGCAHDCPYCYARFRGTVKDSLKTVVSTFAGARPLLPEAELLKAISREADSGRIEIVKLSRYTDIFTPEFVKNGLALKILGVLAGSKVKRIIITTKGLPGADILELIAAYPGKFSYNAAMRPSSLDGTGPLSAFDRGLKPMALRLEAASAAARTGALTTIHLDPFAAGFDDRETVLRPFLEKLKAHGLDRVMFSYLLLSDEMAAGLETLLPPGVFQTLKANYDASSKRRYLPKQDETVYWALKPEIKRASVEKTAELLTSMCFKFVLCSLKNTPGLDTAKFKNATLCDGKFYA